MARGDLHDEQQHAQAQSGLDEQFAFFGLAPDGPVVPELEPFYLWPEHAQAWGLFLSLQTQWRVGQRGATGLDYAAVIAHLQVVTKPRHFRRRYAEILCLESGALQGLAEVQRERGESR